MAQVNLKRLQSAYGEDYGTRYFKYSPLMEKKPRIMESAGLFLEESQLLKLYGVEQRLVVGPDVRRFMGERSEVARNLVYPLRDGEVPSPDKAGREWEVIEELTRKGLKEFEEYKKRENFNGFCVTAAISALTFSAPTIDGLLKIHKKLDAETGLVNAFTAITQPLAVAISEKELTCVVVEAGHGNTQVVPVSRRPIEAATAALYRGGGEADAIAAEILRDLGYSDLASDDYAVRKFKEEAGLVPRNLDGAIRKAKEDPHRVRCTVRISALTEVDMSDKGWYRFFIGEVIFNPTHEIYESYRKKGALSIRPVRVGDETYEGSMPLDEAIVRSIEKTSPSLHDDLLRKIILSGGSFQWRVPENLKDIAVDSATKVKLLLEQRSRGYEVSVKLVSDPQYSVWKGCVVWSAALPENYLWKEERREGWFKRGHDW